MTPKHHEKNNVKGHSSTSLKYIFVTGGVMSGLGKGILSSSISALLEARGYKVEPIKIDGYLNVDAGTMNPIEHGEVFVLDDGTECDMDLGNYERFLDKALTSENSLTTGKIMQSVIQKERRGEYLGKTVQMIPHVTGEIKQWIRNAAKKSDADFVVVEIGGTVGDLENQMFIEAAREIHSEEPKRTVAFVHLTLVPVMGVVGEQKSKPTQHSIKELQHMGIQPDIIVARSEKMLDENIIRKIKLFGDVNYVISDPDLKSIYEGPVFFENEGLMAAIEDTLSLPKKGTGTKDWKNFIDKLLDGEKTVIIAITGKYTQLHDAYTSIFESLAHASAKNKVRYKLKWVETTNLSYDDAKKALSGVDGIIVPGGFGSRGVEGKINCVRFARENNMPFLGLCYGMQIATIEYARNVCGLNGANTSEVDKNTSHPVIHVMESQKGIENLGGTMRLGAYPAALQKRTLVHTLYGKDNITERHRHRYEVNPDYIKALESKGLVFSGKSPSGKLMEFLELPKHRFFVATQAHPEFKSRPLLPHPLFDGFVLACSGKKG